MRYSRLALAGVLVLLGAAAPAPKFFASIVPGQWRISSMTEGARRLCVRDPAMLIPLHDPARQCTFYTVSDASGTATIHYTCPGHGAGRTTLIRDDNGRVEIKTQGVDDGAPFQESYIAHRIGACARGAR